MSAVLIRARSELRARLPSLLALAIVLGLGLGAVLTTAAGARRTDSSYKRFAVAHKAADMLIYPTFSSDFAALDFDRVERLPEVVAAARTNFFFTAEQAQIITGDARFGTVIDQPKLLEGRMPAPGSTDEAAAGYEFAKRAHLHIGSVLTYHAFSTDPKAPPFVLTFRIVGIEASPGEFPPQLGGFFSGPSGTTDLLHAGDAFYRAFHAKVFSFEALLLRFRHGGADVPSVVAQLNKMAGGKPQLNAILGDQAANVQRSIHLQAVALWIVGALVALIGLLVLSQLLARQAVLDSGESPTLLALGMTRTQIWLTGMGRSALVGLAGAIVGVCIAIAFSPLMPIGTARIAETHPGVSFDPFVLGVGVAATVLGVLLLAAWPIWRSTGRVRYEGDAAGSAKPSIVARAAAGPGFPPPVAAGVRLALEAGRGRTQVPVRSSLVSVILAIAALASSLTFAASLDHLLATPRLYGWNWDAHLTTSNDEDTLDPALKVLNADPNVQDVAVIDTPPLALGRQHFDSVVLKQIKGSIVPVVMDGRAAIGPDEVALGAKTLHDAHAHIGSTVQLSIAAIDAPPAPFKVVGTVVLPPNSAAARLGVGAQLSIEGERSMIPPGVQPPALTDLYARFAPGVDKKEALSQLRQSLKDRYEVLLPFRPSDLVNFGQVQNLPLLLAGLVALLAAVTLAHTLITSIRRRRRDFAILKMLGFVPSQVRWAVAWQATTFVSVALLIGLPLGIAAGRTIWTVFAGQLGTISEPVYPSLPLLVTIPGAIVLANLIATIPGMIAGRMKPAIVLRAE